MTDPVIRIVDDDPRMHDVLQFVLESEGYSVRHFFSAEDFLAGDFLSDPGCAVLDVRMGKMSGLVLQRVLKEREVDLPVIFLSAHGDIGMAVDAIDSGAVTFLTKPVRAEKLLTAVDKALSRKGSAEVQTTDAREVRKAFAALSDREREVALLAGQKLTNRQIAERLELAVRTVEFHRAGAMRKLGTHSAKELTEKLIAAGALGS